jgi:hypothetical protein
MVNAFIPALAPIFGGMIADYLVSHQLVADYSLKVPIGGSAVTIFRITNWNLFFMFSALMAFASLRFLKTVKEEGEVGKQHVVVEMFANLRTRIEKREFFSFKGEKRA